MCHLKNLKYESIYYYQFAFMYYRTKVDIQSVKKKVKLLDDRYDMLLKMLMVHKS